jgi:hypothetical protein
MSDIKKKLLAAIDTKTRRREALKKEIAERHKNIEAFVMKMINDLEDMVVNTANTSLLVSLVPIYVKSLESQVKTIDSGSTTTVQWLESNGTVHVNGILIKWSKDYQVANNCDPELFVDVTNLLFS